MPVTPRETAATVSITGASYYLPPTVRSLGDLARDGLLSGAVEPLQTFGFANVHIAADESQVDMAVCAARSLLEDTGTSPDDVDLLLYAGALASSNVEPCAPPPAGSVLNLTSVAELFRYPASMLQHELDLANAVVAGVSQQGCASLFTAIRMGRDALIADPSVRQVLCVASDRLPSGAPRDVVLNVISDGSCAVLLRRDETGHRILACHQVSKPMMYGDASLDAEVIAAYFPTAVSTIETTLRACGLTIDDIAWIIPHNVSLRSWEILLGMLRAPRARLYSANIARVGHTIAADNVINLRDAHDAGLIAPGDKLLLFTFGFGLNWSCMILEHA
jgi:3-oxoacyl-[acyl-carrier-protein] synthase-3